MGTPGARNAPLIAVDTNVLLDLADENPGIIDCFTTINERFANPRILVLPTVIQELAALTQATGKKRSTAQLALQSILDPWGFHPVSCVPVGYGIVEETARKIRAARLLPDEEVNDSFILAEAALVGAILLVSNDHHLRDIAHAALKPVLLSCDLAVPLIVSPFKVSTFFLKG